MEVWSMSGPRFTLDCYIPSDVYATIPAAKKLAFRDAVRAIKAYARKINAGAANEEMTVKATYHICHHDEPGNTIPCNITEQDI